MKPWIPDCWSGDRKCTGPKCVQIHVTLLYIVIIIIIMITVYRRCRQQLLTLRGPPLLVLSDVGSWTSCWPGRLSVPSSRPTRASAAATDTDYAHTSRAALDATARGNSRTSARRPRWSAAAGIGDGCGTCRRLQVADHEPVRPRRSGHATTASAAVDDKSERTVGFRGCCTTLWTDRGGTPPLPVQPHNIYHLRSMLLPQQVAQLSQRESAAGCVSFGQKWKTTFCRQHRSIFNHCDVIGLQSYRILSIPQSFLEIMFQLFYVCIPLPSIAGGKHYVFVRCLSVSPSVDFKLPTIRY